MTTYRLWPATNGPGSQESDSTTYTLAVEFYATTTGCTLTEIHFWASTTLAGSDHVCRLYTAAGVLVPGGSGTFPSPLQPGWNTVTLASPVALTANARYLAGVYFSTDDGYTKTGAYWSSGGGASGVTNGPLSAPAAGGATGPGQGCFRVAAGDDDAPNGTFDSSNYWVDVTVDDNAAGTATGTAAATIGGLSGAATGRRTVYGRAGGGSAVTGEAIPGEMVPGDTGGGSLGGLTGVASGLRKVFGVAAGASGGLSGAASGLRKVLGTAAATIGGLSGAASGEGDGTSEIGTATGAIGGLSGAATGRRTVRAVLTATIGGLSGRAVVAAPTSPATPTAVGGSWGSLLALVREAHNPTPDPREAACCPNDGFTLLPDPRGGLRCPFDGFRR